MFNYKLYYNINLLQYNETSITLQENTRSDISLEHVQIVQVISPIMADS